jgi:hypothetical protein
MQLTRMVVISQAAGRRSCGSLVAGLLLLAAGGCAPNAPAQVAVTPGAPVTLKCQDVIGSTAAPETDYAIVLDRVALPTGRVLQARESGESDPAARLFAKTGLLIRRGSSFELVVPDDWRGRLTIAWGSPGQRTDRLGVSDCRPTRTLNPIRQTDPWLAYAGGFYVSGPACVSLVVRAGKAVQTVPIAVAAPCPGQAALPSPPTG